MTRARGGLIGVFAVAVLAAGLLAGCGGDSEPPPPGTPSAAEFLVDSEALAEQEKGSPGEALLLWWRSLQYNDFGGYLAGLSAPLREQRSNEAAQDDLAIAYGEISRSQPKVVDTKITRGNATVYTRIETRTPLGASRFTTSSTPQAFSLVREGNKWKIADDFYVRNKAEQIKKAQEGLEAQEAGAER